MGIDNERECCATCIFRGTDENKDYCEIRFWLNAWHSQKYDDAICPSYIHINYKDYLVMEENMEFMD